MASQHLEDVFHDVNLYFIEQNALLPSHTRTGKFTHSEFEETVRPDKKPPPSLNYIIYPMYTD